MLSETGRVVAIDKDGLWVETLKTSSCAKCSAQSGCGQNLAAKLLPNSHMTLIKALFTPSGGHPQHRYQRNRYQQDGYQKDGYQKDSHQQNHDLQWRVGDYVVVGVEENAFVIAATIAYGIPLVAFIVGLFIAQGFSTERLSGDAMSALGAFAGLFLGGLLVKSFSRVQRSVTYFQAVVLGRADSSEEPAVELVVKEPA